MKPIQFFEIFTYLYRGESETFLRYQDIADNRKARS